MSRSKSEDKDIVHTVDLAFAVMFMIYVFASVISAGESITYPYPYSFPYPTLVRYVLMAGIGALILMVWHSVRGLLIKVKKGASLLHSGGTQ